MKLKTLLRYRRLIDFVTLVITLIIFFTFKPNAFVLVPLTVIPPLLLDITLFYKIHTSLKKEAISIFGITKNKINFELLSTLFFGVGLFAVFYFDVFSFSENSSFFLIWITSIYITKLIESFIPYSYWSVIRIDDKLYQKEHFGMKEIPLSQGMKIKEITTDKIELRMNELSYELPIKKEELERFTAVIQIETRENI